jgi:hypothetical protein
MSDHKNKKNDHDRDHHRQEQGDNREKFRLRTQVWKNGVLTTEEYWVESFLEAKNFASMRSKKVHLVKIYNDEGELVHQENYTPQQETYA